MLIFPDTFIVREACIEYRGLAEDNFGRAETIAHSQATLPKEEWDSGCDKHGIDGPDNYKVRRKVYEVLDRYFERWICIVHGHSSYEKYNHEQQCKVYENAPRERIPEIYKVSKAKLVSNYAQIDLLSHTGVRSRWIMKPAHCGSSCRVRSWARLSSTGIL